jgi:DNA-binding MarR family transcriptional regulator
MGTRYHFNRLVENGWIELVANEKDTRMKVCRPTDKFNSRFEQIVEELARLN